MMAITALSIPEMVILRRIMKARLIAAFVSVVGFGILPVLPTADRLQHTL
jgi:uncharacterized protein